MATPSVYIGKASIDLLTSQTIAPKAEITTSINPNTSPPLVTWTNEKGTQIPAPPGTNTNFLGASFPSNYIYKLDVQYKLLGSCYGDAGTKITFNITTVDTKGNSTVEVIPPSRSKGLYSYWEYGTKVSYWTVANPVIPTSLSITVKHTGINYAARNVFWTAFYTMTIVNGCSDSRLIDNPVCKSFCLSNPQDISCVQNYSAYCLGANQDAIATPLCLNYYSAYIQAKGGSNGEIDSVIRRYCKRYKTFGDLFDSTDPNVQKDVELCACHMTSSVQPDPNGTVLYENFYKSLVGQNNIFGQAVFSQQEKCLVYQCRSSPFPSKEIPPGGCKVPQCFNVVVFNNDGTINGGVDIDQTVSGCSSGDGGGGGGGGGDSNAIGIIAIVLIFVVIFVIVLFVVVFSSSGRRQYPAYRNQQFQYSAVQ